MVSRLAAIWGAVWAHRACAAVMAVHGLVLLCVLPPTGEFPVCDDGVFAATARDLVREGRLRVSDLPAMSLVTHALWGAAFLTLFGDSWQSLHLATVVMTWWGGWAMYVLCREWGRSPSEAALACGSYLFCPLIFADAYSFMTDVTAASLMLTSLAVMPAVLRHSSHLLWSVQGVLGAACYLVRQTAAIPACAFGVWLLWECVRRRRRPSELAAYGWPILLLIGAYTLWLHTVNGVPSVHGSVSLKFDLFWSPRGLASKLAGLGLESALLLAPLAAWVGGTIPWRQLWRQRQWSLILAAVMLAGAALHADELRPYRGYSLYDAGLGYPPTYEGLAALRSAGLTAELTIFHAVTLTMAALLFLAVVLALVAQWPRERSTVSEATQAQNVVRGVIAASLVVYLVLLLSIEYVFDRYVIPLALLGMIGTLSMVRQRPAGCAQWIGWITLTLVALCSVLGTADAVQTRRVFWAAVDQLRARGVADEQIEAGNAHLMAYVYEPAVRRRPVSGPTFLAGLPPGTYNGFDRTPKSWKLAFRPVPGWEVSERIPYATCLRTCELLILRPASPRE